MQTLAADRIFRLLQVHITFRVTFVIFVVIVAYDLFYLFHIFTQGKPKQLTLVSIGALHDVG